MIRSELTAVPPDYHGAIDFAELARWGIKPDDMLDFSVNSNPFGPVAHVREALKSTPLDRYPDKACLALRAALSAHLDLPRAQIHVGNGSAELLWLLSFACLQRGDQVVVIGPTFGEYARNAQLMGAQVTQWRARPEDNFAIHPAEIDQLLNQVRPSLLYLCNPNNPTGQIVACDVIAHWAQRWPQTLFVIDEAYLAFVPKMRSVIDLQLDNMLVLRSMTKDYALAGLRLGYAVGPQTIIDGLAQVQIPWSVNSLAQAAGIAALQKQAEYEMLWQHLREETAVFRQSLQALGYSPMPSATHYFLMNVGDGQHWREALLPHGILVRLCASYQLPQFVRIATRTPADNNRLLTALQQMG